MTSRILLLSGMTPNDRIFDRLLPLLPTASIVRWIEPFKNESLSEYTLRLAETIPVQEPTIVCGVSFGGVVARELAVRLNSKTCVVISSIQSPSQLPPWFRMLRPCARYGFAHFLNGIGTLAAAVPRRIRTGSTLRLTKLAGDRGSWYRWVTTAFLNWKPTLELDVASSLQVHGDRDTTFPIRYIKPNITICGGGHVLPLTHSVEIAEILNGLAN
ncbi:MAG: alpha/beta hydrolase [Planctomycetia bacterium]|nr:alpha/beta hydrolase [Planctomycetia bacterium]